MTRWCLVAAVISLASCQDQAPACKTVNTDCAALYGPHFDDVYNTTLAMKCGSDQTSCHSAAGLKGGMTFQDEAHAYASLLEDGKHRVEPGDPECSLMIVRVNSPGADYQMPPGDALSEPERCALIKWVEAGAPGPGQ